MIFPDDFRASRDAAALLLARAPFPVVLAADNTNLMGELRNLLATNGVAYNLFTSKLKPAEREKMLSDMDCLPLVSNRHLIATGYRFPNNTLFVRYLELEIVITNSKGILL